MFRERVCLSVFLFFYVCWCPCFYLVLKTWVFKNISPCICLQVCLCPGFCWCCNCVLNRFVCLHACFFKMSVIMYASVSISQFVYVSRPCVPWIYNFGYDRRFFTYLYFLSTPVYMSLVLSLSVCVCLSRLHVWPRLCFFVCLSVQLFCGVLSSKLWVWIIYVCACMSLWLFAHLSVPPRVITNACVVLA